MFISTTLLFTFQVLFPLSRTKSIPAQNDPDSYTDQIPLPEWDRYLKSVSKITLNEKNKEYSKFLKDFELRKKLEKDGTLDDETLHKIEEAFDRMIQEEDRKLLNSVKKKEIDAIRRRLIPTKKRLSKELEIPAHLNITVLKFTAQDIGLLIKANMEHVKKFRDLRETDFKQYEMEKRFLEDQRMRHLKTEMKRKKELETIEAEKAKRAAVNVKHPMSEDAAKDVWEEKEKLPKNEFDPKTFFALNDLDSNGLLDLEEVRMILRKELENAYDKEVPGDDKREQKEEMERMRDHIYKEVDKNGDLMIDFEEFLEQIHEETKNKDWETIDNESKFNDTEFEEFERRRVNEIRDEIADGKKPKGYNYEDVPLLDDNFLNETHIRYGGVMMKVDDSPHDVREKVFKEYAMKKQFEEEQVLRHVEDPLKRRRMELEKEIEKTKKIKVHEPLSPEQLKSTWKEQDHQDESEYNTEKFFHLHDINGDKLIDRQELRMMVITELTDSYKKANRSHDSEEFREDLERIREEVFEQADTDKDGFISKTEFFAIVAENQKKQEEKTLHEESEFTEEEYNQFRHERVMEIRRLIANGALPTNYNYSDVPLLSGNFINTTHIQRDGVIVDIHNQRDKKQKIKDFKRLKMEARFKFEHKIKDMSPEDQKREKAKLEKINNERKMKHKKVAAPMSETQEKEVWEKDDKMESSDFSLQKYFNLHDVDASGKWNKQEVIASLMQQLDKMYNISDTSLKEKRTAEMQSWLGYVFGTGDLDKDGEIDFTELEYLNKLSHDKKDKEEDEWKDIEDDEEYTEDEFDKFKDEEFEEYKEGDFA